jgi:predicted glycogen debranching enzyme
VPSTSVKSNGNYTHEPHWYRNFLYTEERARGLNHSEDLAAPGVFAFDISVNSIAEMAFAASGHESILRNSFEEISQREGKRRGKFPSNLSLAADAYLVRRGKGSTIIAGYPWFGDWGRDTFIAMRGLCLATGRLDEARSILLEWADSVYAGLLPNRFADDGTSPEYNSVDAALWFIITTQEFLQAAKDVNAQDAQKLKSAIESILDGYSQGTSFSIKMDVDCLLACGVPGMQLTWMDARIDCDVVTPRIGKPVEVQALWLNALSIGATFNKHWAAHRDKGMASFQAKFWNEDAAALFDVIDVDHQTGVNDGSIRPNQVFAIGGLPVSIIEGARAKQVLETVERQLLTPAGLRTLAPGSQGYVGCYGGDAWHRDHAYHQGTVWPWLMGPYVQAWLQIHGNTAALRKEARTRFLDPLMKHYSSAGLGHISEIADADEPHTPKGAPFQAWSIGELIRLENLLAS